MAGAAMNKARILLIPLLGVALALGGCGRGGDAAAPPLAGATLGGPFTLTDQDGRSRTDTAFLGKYRLMYFGYTYCPDVCPTSLQTLMKGVHLLASRAPATAAKVQPIFVTVDPERDTPAVMKSYVGAFGPELIGLTGSSAQIAAVAKRYAVFYQKRAEKGSSDYLVDHMSQAMLFGPKGEPIALVPQDGTPEQVADELAKWVR
ncbi:MAG: SCO family protein [Sphingomonadales bacterium]|nr:MAG: SCO family protein [Sphingomonadales bacterium]